MILTHLALFSFLDGASGTDAPPVVVAETYSGGWGRKGRVSPFETESDSERRARIHADRIRLGIIARDEEKPTAVERADGEISGVPATLLSPEAAGFDAGAYDAALALDLAELHTSAWLDQEIRRHFALQDLDDEEALYAILALARTLH